MKFEYLIQIYNIPSSITLLPCYLVPSSRIRPLATAVAAPLHPALSLASRFMVLMVAPLEYPMSVSSHLCLGLPLQYYKNIKMKHQYENKEVILDTDRNLCSLKTST